MRISLILLICAEWHLYAETAAQEATIPPNLKTSASPPRKGCIVGDFFRRGTINSIANFEELIRCTTFIDKTGLVPEFFKNSGHRQFHLVTCPHKFGKTINLNMMKKFLEGSVTVEGNEISKAFDSEVYDFFINPKYNFTVGTMIENITELHKEHFQAYSTIHLSFKTVGSDSFDKLTKGLRDNFRKTFQEYEWFSKILSDTMSGKDADSKAQIKLLKRAVDGDIDKDEFAESLFALANLITKFCPIKEVFLLIDDYDDPVIKAIEQKFDVKRCVRLIDEIFTSLFVANEPSIRYALILGTINVLEKTKFNHVKHWSFLDNHHFVKYFGFTDDEVERLLDEHGVNRHDKAVIKRYYCGYTVSSTTKRMYNPYSMSHYLCSRNPSNAELMTENYWAEVTNIRNFLSCFRRNPLYRDMLTKMLSLKKISFPLRRNFDLNALEKLQEITHDDTYELTNVRLEVALSYLLHNGYLSYADTPRTYRVPNEEIRSALNLSCVEADQSFAIADAELLAKLSPPEEKQVVVPKTNSSY